MEMCYFSNFVKSADLCSDDSTLMMQPFSVETRRRLCVCEREFFKKTFTVKQRCFLYRPSLLLFCIWPKMIC